MWCSINAEQIELSPVVSVEEILGAAPSDAFTGFYAGPDEAGFIDWFEVDRCPLVQVDPIGPHYEPGWLGDVAGLLWEIQAGVPAGWLDMTPTAVTRDGLVMIKSAVDAASAHRSRTGEEW